MLQNLLGTPLGGLSNAVVAPGGSVETPVKPIDTGLEKFDKSLVTNSFSTRSTQAAAIPNAGAGDVLPGAGIQPAELVEQLRVALGVLMQELATGSELPVVGNALPDTLPPQIAAAMAQISQFEAKLSAGVTELDSGELQALVDSLAGLLHSLETALPAASGGFDAATSDSLVAKTESILPGANAIPATAAIAAVQVAVAPAAAGHKALVAQAGSTLPVQARVQSLGAQIRELLTASLAALQQVVDTRAGLSTAAQGLTSQATALSPVVSPAMSANPALLPLPGAGEMPVAAAPGAALALQTGSTHTGAPVTAEYLSGNAAASANLALNLAGGITGQRMQAVPGDQQINPAALGALRPLAGSLLQAAATGAAGGELTGKRSRAIETLGTLLQSQAPAANQAQPAALASLSNLSPHASVQTFATNVALPVMSGQWGSQIAQRIGWLTGQGINTANIHLNPPELGPMQVRIDSSENAARVTISVHSAVTREALETQLPRLRDLFTEQGLDLVDVDVDNRDFTGGGSHAADDEHGSDEGAGSESANGSQPVAGPVNAGANLPAGGRAGGDTIVLHYALVDAYA